MRVCPRRTSPGTRMRNLFLPPGLGADDPAIVRIIRGHRLPLETRIGQTPFWSRRQRRFQNGKIHGGGTWASLAARSAAPLHAHSRRARTTGGAYGGIAGCGPPQRRPRSLRRRSAGISISTFAGSVVIRSSVPDHAAGSPLMRACPGSPA